MVAGDLFGERGEKFGGGVSNAGRPRLSIRLMASLLHLKNSFNLSDKELVERWSENVVWQLFSAQEYYEPRLPCDATRIGRLRRAIGEEGLELLLKSTIETAIEITAVKPTELERVIVDTTVMKRAIAHPAADDRARQVRPADRPVLVARHDGRCAARAESRSGLQRPMAASGDFPPRPKLGFLRLLRVALKAAFDARSSCADLPTASACSIADRTRRFTAEISVVAVA